MKRYDMCAISGHVEEIEHPLGFWIKWEDVKDQLGYGGGLVDENRKLRDAAYKAGYFEGQNSERIKRVLPTMSQATTLECNCKEELNAMKSGWKCEIIGDNVVLTNSWICPAHGYKKR